MKQPSLLACRRTAQCDSSDAGLFSKLHGERDIDQLVCIVDLRSRLNLRLEVSILLKKEGQSRFRQRDPGLVIGVLLLQIHHLQQACIGK